MLQLREVISNPLTQNLPLENITILLEKISITPSLKKTLNTVKNSQPLVSNVNPSRRNSDSPERILTLTKQSQPLKKNPTTLEKNSTIRKKLIPSLQIAYIFSTARQKSEPLQKKLQSVILNS